MTHSSAPAKPALTSEDRSARIAVSVFPALILLAAAFGFFVPDVGQMLAPHTSLYLGVIMFAMGLTLTLPDFGLVARRPLPVLIGVVAQYVIMPLVGLGVSLLLQLPPELAVGVILVGCAPGGTSSNVITYLAKADTALSVTMTSISTLLAPLLTPLLTLWLAGSYLPVDAGSMAMSIVKMVLIPVIGGLVVRLVLGKLVDTVLPALPWVSVAGISLVVIAVVSGSTEAIVSAGAIVLLAVVLHNALGYLIGYWAARLLRQGERAARTTSIEVGMQNSGLAATLAASAFSPAAALPAAIFSIWHNLSGAMLAMYYRRSADRHPAAHPQKGRPQVDAA
ncbi:bile acid:sodium symporter family protein [Brachybacterium alimentarium]|uniref:bile acid:sodium symporter family protein n=1 Tax=Brachybacterium alimentarium TaxID=47845 RepID=UPI000BB9A3C5|nr:bile acid:sodium symporter family protein [Brachybacterium alimentarium]PCC34351.1 Bile acid:sodium symporter [Brachybacterium alimentarium]RCS67418.1 bile acid:sodium symporter family protein [Brachybacterium alimentarium]RCS76350.1 bile acid:sodium symporter family protein [Brachybacterium alimentarium]RCS87644.1 bile acid:sodium symporter family protein [Brachybacterium alimentarium]